MLGVVIIASVMFLAPPAEPSTPKTLDARLVIEPFAAAPDVVTPTGLTVDRAGRVLVIESHTHFRPENYKGPAADRIRLLEDLDGDGRAEKISTFYEGSKHTMGLGFHPSEPTLLFVATRAEIFVLRDKDGDGRADGPKETIAALETPGDYPHNGLSGFAFDAEGRVYFGLGENLGAAYKLVARDGTTLSGGGEGGNIYRCKPDGSGLERYATGFWNPFHLTFDTYGRLFAVDNDPDSRPPCRLLHVVPDGDYGYRFRNGRKGLHPFTAWNGELPGTLPMVAGTGEAPSGVLAYESDQLPEDYRGNLLVTSWGDHRIERFRLKHRGASFESKAELLVTGGEDFRPVAIATAPDGSIFLSDWVDKSYSVHGKGRVWHLRAKDAPKRVGPKDDKAALSHPDRSIRQAAANRLGKDEAGRLSLRKSLTGYADPRARAEALRVLALAKNPDDANALREATSDPSEDVREMAVRMAPIQLLGEIPLIEASPSALVRAEALRRFARVKNLPVSWAVTWTKYAKELDPFLLQAARRAFSFELGFFEEMVRNGPAESRLQAILTLRERGSDPDAILPLALKDPDPRVQFVAIEWIGDEKLTKYRPELRSGLASGATTRQLFEAYLAALERTDGVSRGSKDEWAGESYVAALLTDPKTPPSVLARALRMLRGDHPAITLERLREWLKSSDDQVRIEAVRTLRESTLPGRFETLATIAGDSAKPEELRAEALVGLSADAANRRDLLLTLAVSPSQSLRHEALRGLRAVPLTKGETAGILKAGEQDLETAALIELMNGPKPALVEPLETWTARLDGPSDPSAGQRVFFNSKGAACYRCHQVDGRGGRIGPDLSKTAATLSKERLIESIINPSKEVAPQFVSWLVARKDGTLFTGTLLDESASGEQTYADSKGDRIVVKSEAIADRRPQTTSIMPADLANTMTTREFRDVIGYLRGVR